MSQVPAEPFGKQANGVSDTEGLRGECYGSRTWATKAGKTYVNEFGHYLSVVSGSIRIVSPPLQGDSSRRFYKPARERPTMTICSIRTPEVKAIDEVLSYAKALSIRDICMPQYCTNIRRFDLRLLIGDVCI